ncbi:MAG TPA: ribonuclease H, partial [Tepidiformaceae bacterium]
MAAPDTFRCTSCGDEFSLSPSVRAKYPNWTPRTCMSCREQPANGGGKQRQRGNSATRNGNLSPLQVLERFTAGPQDGIFTDGSCQGNPGPGGWGAVYVRGGQIVEERSGYDPATTNNRMELTAMIQGLSMVGPDEAVDVYSDSALVVDTLTKWAKG